MIKEGIARKKKKHKSEESIHGTTILSEHEE